MSVLLERQVKLAEQWRFKLSQEYPEAAILQVRFQYVVSLAEVMQRVISGSSRRRDFLLTKVGAIVITETTDHLCGATIESSSFFFSPIGGPYHYYVRSARAVSACTATIKNSTT